MWNVAIDQEVRQGVRSLRVQHQLPTEIALDLAGQTMGKKLLQTLSVLGLVIFAACVAAAQNVVTLGATGSNIIISTGTGSSNWTLRLTSDTARRPNTWQGGFPCWACSLWHSGGGGYYRDRTFGRHKPLERHAICSMDLQRWCKWTLLERKLGLLNLTKTGRTPEFDATLEVDLTNLSGHQSIATTFGPAIYADTFWFRDYRPRPSHEAGYPQPALVPTDPTPEPQSILLVGSGLLVLGGLAWRRSRKA